MRLSFLMNPKGAILAAAALVLALAALLRTTAPASAVAHRRSAPATELPAAAPETTLPEAAEPEADPLREKLLHGESVSDEIARMVEEPASWTEPLRRMAESDPDERCRAFAVRVLSLMGDSALESFLVDRLLLDGALLPRYAAARGLERLESLRPATFDALASVLRSETNDKLIDGIRDALARHEIPAGSPLGGDEW